MMIVFNFLYRNLSKHLIWNFEKKLMKLFLLNLPYTFEPFFVHYYDYVVCTPWVYN